MQINLTWDLFVIVFFLVIVAYSFVIGKNQTMKIILSAYAAILAADGLANLVQKYLLGDDPVVSVVTIHADDNGFVIMKIAIFVILTVLLTVRGGFEIALSSDRSQFLGLFMTAAYGILSAGLIISTILVYISGGSLFEGAVLNPQSAISQIAQESALVRTMIANYDVWFGLPVVIFMISSLFGTSEE